MRTIFHVVLRGDATGGNNGGHPKLKRHGGQTLSIGDLRHRFFLEHIPGMPHEGQSCRGEKFLSTPK
jgi:hypothetical protein